MYNGIKVGDSMGGKYTEAQKRATQKYKAQSRDKLTLDIPKGEKERYKEHAQRQGKSLTALIVDLLEQDIQRADSKDTPTYSEE